MDRTQNNILFHETFHIEGGNFPSAGTISDQVKKILKKAGPILAIITTSVLFGISHLSYTYAYAAIIAIILGVLLSIVVYKTKNLYSAIFAHTLINITSLTLYFFGQSFWM